jgi:SulP family sulfate permease
VTAILAGFIIGALSGAPYQISGPTGAMSAVLIVIAQRVGHRGRVGDRLLAGAIVWSSACCAWGALSPSSLVGDHRLYVGHRLHHLCRPDRQLSGCQTPSARVGGAKIPRLFSRRLAPDWTHGGSGLLVIDADDLLAKGMEPLCARLADRHHRRDAAVLATGWPRPTSALSRAPFCWTIG